jgi:hypothetical protein
MKKILILLLIACLALPSNGQKFEDFYKHALEIHVVQSIPGYTSLGVQVASGNVGKWKLGIEYTSLIIPDGIIFSLHALSEKHPEKSNFSNIWGSLAVGVNVVSTDKLIVCAGANLTDYWEMGNRPGGANGGWYTAGTFARLDYAISDKFMIRLRNYASKSFFSANSIFKGGPMDEGMPWFIRTGLEVHYGKRLMIGGEIINQISDPLYDCNRANLKVGFKVSKFGNK